MKDQIKAISLSEPTAGLSSTVQETASPNPGESSMRSGSTRAPEIYRLVAQ